MGRAVGAAQSARRSRGRDQSEPRDVELRAEDAAAARKGRTRKSIYTTWDLPVTSRPHDTRIGKDGLIYFNHFNDNAIGRLDPKTGETKEWRWPYRAKQGSFAPTGARTLMGPDHEGPLLHRQPGAGRPGRLRSGHGDSSRFENPPGGGEMMDVSGSHVDGHGWRVRGRRRLPDQSRDLGVTRRSRARGRSTPTTSLPIRRTTCTAPARNSQLRLEAWTDHDAAGRLLRHPGAAAQRGRPSARGMRRGITDEQDRLWWGGYDGNFVGMLDPRRPAGKEITLYPMPPWFFPYDAHHDDGLHVDRRHLRRSRRAVERRRRASGTTTCCRSRPTSATSICSRPRQAACQGCGSATRIRRRSRWSSRSRR